MNKYTFFIFLMVLTASVKGQGVPISQLPPVTTSYHGSLDTTALLPVVQDSVPGKKKTYKASVANIKSLLGSTTSSNTAWVLGGNGDVSFPEDYIGSSNGGSICLSSGNPLLTSNVSFISVNKSQPGIIGSITLMDIDSIYEETTSIGIHLAGGIGKVLSIRQSTYDGDTSATLKLLKDSIVFEFVKNLGMSEAYTFPNYKPVAGQLLGANTNNGHLDWITPTSFTPSDSLTIYSLTPSNFTSYACTDCTGNGITGAILTFIDGLWRRLKFD